MCYRARAVISDMVQRPISISFFPTLNTDPTHPLPILCALPPTCPAALSTTRTCSAVARRTLHAFRLPPGEYIGWHTRWFGQNCIYTLYVIVYLVASLPRKPYMHCAYMALANPAHLQTSLWILEGVKGCSFKKWGCVSCKNYQYQKLPILVLDTAGLWSASWCDCATGRAEKLRHGEEGRNGFWNAVRLILLLHMQYVVDQNMYKLCYAR
jgi:hypothetical protein